MSNVVGNIIYKIGEFQLYCLRKFSTDSYNTLFNYSLKKVTYYLKIQFKLIFPFKNSILKLIFIIIYRKKLYIFLLVFFLSKVSTKNYLKMIRAKWLQTIKTYFTQWWWVGKHKDLLSDIRTWNQNQFN